jgi:hypothetical protein
MAIEEEWNFPNGRLEQPSIANPTNYFKLKKGDSKWKQNLL